MEHFSLNLQLMSFLYAGIHPATWALRLATFLAQDAVILYPLVLIYRCLRYRNERALICVIFISVLLACGLSALIGHLLPTQRPFFDGIVTAYLPHAPNYSFPSDHTTLSCTIAFGFIWGRRYLLGTGLLVLGLLIGLSRVYLGIHYPLDIVGGCVLGFLCAGFCMLFLLKPFQQALL